MFTNKNITDIFFSRSRLKKCFFLFSVFILFFEGNSIGQQTEEQRVDSLDRIADTTSSIRKRSEVLFELAATFIGSDPIRSRRYSETCIEAAENSNYLLGIGDCSNSLGLLHFYQSNYDTAQIVFERLISIGRTLNDSILLFKGYGNMGLVHSRIGKLNQAILYFQKSLRINEAMGRLWSVAKLNGDIGGVYMLMGDWSTAMNFQRSALQTYKMLKSERGVAKAMNAIGVVFQEQLVYDSARWYFEESLATKIKYGKNRAWVTTKGNLCRLYTDLKEKDDALACFEELIPIEKKFGMQHDLSLSLNNLALLYADSKQIKKGIETGKQALMLAEKIKSVQAQRGANNALSLLYEKSGDYKNAFHYATASRIAHDSFVNERQTERIAELQTQFETEKKEKTIALQALEIENNNQRIRFQQLITIGAVISIAGLFAFLLWRFRHRQKMQRQKDALMYQEQLLHSTVSSVEEERKRISKDLHDGIGQQLAGLKLAWENITGDITGLNESNTSKIDELTVVLQDVTDEVRNISHQMMPAALRELGLVPAIEDMLNKSFEYSNIACNFEHVGVNERFTERIEIGLYRICQELINNIIKHAEASHVEVHLFKTAKQIILKVSDDGKGFSPDALSQAGNGMNNIQSRIKSVNGDVQYERENGQGVSAHIRIPIPNQGDL